MFSGKAIGRLSLYRRILGEFIAEGASSLRSYQLADRAGVSAAQVRRDLMLIGYEGSPRKGYDAQKLLDSLVSFLSSPQDQHTILIGVGNLGRALLSYFANRGHRENIVAAFDVDPQNTGRVIHGCKCYHFDELTKVWGLHNIKVAIVAVPAHAAQKTVDKLVSLGIKGIINFAPVRLKSPDKVYIENVDLTMLLEKVAFFARENDNAV